MCYDRNFPGEQQRDESDSKPLLDSIDHLAFEQFLLPDKDKIHAMGKERHYKIMDDSYFEVGESRFAPTYRLGKMRRKQRDIFRDNRENGSPETVSGNVTLFLVRVVGLFLTDFNPTVIS